MNHDTDDSGTPPGSIGVDVKLVEPGGRLKVVLDYVNTFPETVPVSIVRLVARLSFVEGYTQLITERTAFDVQMIEQNQEGLEEILETCRMNSAKIKELIQATLEEADGHPR